MTVYNEFYFCPNTWTGLKCHLDEKIVYPILILVNYDYEIKKERRSRFLNILSCSRDTVFRFLTYANYDVCRRLFT